MASPNYSAYLNVKPVEAPDIPDFTKSTDELMKTGMQMARIANAGSGGGRSRANKDVSLRVVPDPSSPNGYRLEYSYGRTPKERIANDAIMDGIRAKQLVANDEVVQGIMQKLDSPDVSYQSKFELMNDLRQNQLSRLQRSSGLSKDMLIDALDLRSRQQGLNAQRKTIEDTSAFKTLYDTGKMMFSRVKDTFTPGQSAEEELAAGKERLAEQQKILENNAYLREQELMAREGRSAYEKAHTSETGSSLLNIGSTIVDSAGDIGVTVGAAALGGASGGAAGTAAAPGPGTVVGSIAGSITGAAGANAAITRQQFIDAIVANPDLTDEQKLDAIRNYSGKAAATGAAVGAAVDIGTLGLGKIAGKVLNRGTANRMVQEAIGKDAAASAAAKAVGNAGARNISRITAEAAGVGTSSAASRNAAYRGLGSYLTRDLPREAATAAAYGGANLMGLNYLLNEATGDNRPITEGLDEALLSGAAFGAVFGLGRNLRRPRNPEGGRRRKVDDQLGELKAPPKEGGDGSTGGDNLLRVDNKKGAPNAEAQYGKYAEPFRKLLHEYEGRETDPNMLRTKMEYYYEQWGKAGLSRDQFDQFLLDNSKASEANRMTPELVSLLKDIHDKAAPAEPVKAAAKGKQAAAQPVAENPNELPSTKVDRLNEVKNIAMPDRLSGGRTTGYMDSIAEVIDRFYEEGGSWADINQYLDEHTSSKYRKQISKSKRGFMPERQMNAIAKAAEIRWKEFQTKKQQAQLLEAMNKNANGKPVARIDDATIQQAEALLNGETPATPAPPAGGNAGVGGANGGAEGRPVVNDTASASGGPQPDAGTAPAAPVVPAGQASRGGSDTASARNGEQSLPSQRPNQAPEAAANEPGSGGSARANSGAGAPAVTGAEAAGAGTRGAAGERSGGTGDSSVQAAAGGAEQPSRTIETETARIQKQLEDLGVPFGVAKNSATLFRANALAFEKAYGRNAANTLARITFVDAGVSKVPNKLGEASIQNPNRMRIFLYSKADPSTVLHEGAHVILQDMINIAREIHHPGIESDLHTLMHYAKLEDTLDIHNLASEQFSQLHEAVARGFEEYMFKGKAPTAELKSVFQRFKEWLGRVYKDIKAYVAGEEGIELNKDVEAVFDRWFTTPEERAAVETLAPKPTAPKGKPRPAPKTRQLSLFDSPPVELTPTDVVNTLSQDAIADRLRADIEGAPHPDDANAAGILIDAGDGSFVRADDLPIPDNMTMPETPTGRATELTPSEQDSLTIMSGRSPSTKEAQGYTVALDDMTETKNRVFEGDDC